MPADAQLVLLRHTSAPGIRPGEDRSRWGVKLGRQRQAQDQVRLVELLLRRVKAAERPVRASTLEVWLEDIAIVSAELVQHDLDLHRLASVEAVKVVARQAVAIGVAVRVQDQIDRTQQR